jgi:hypothetical protein
MDVDIDKKKFEDTKGVNRSHTSRNRQNNGKRTNNDLQKTTQRLKIEQREPY